MSITMDQLRTLAESPEYDGALVVTIGELRWLLRDWEMLLAQRDEATAQAQAVASRIADAIDNTQILPSIDPTIGTEEQHTAYRRGFEDGQRASANFARMWSP